MNYATIKPVDIANGPGVRVSLFVSGCTHRCKGCFNEEAWDFSLESLLQKKFRSSCCPAWITIILKDLTLLGGEPMEPPQSGSLLPFIKAVREQLPGKRSGAFTGYDFEKDILER